MFKPNKKDPLKNRRSLALLAAFHGFFLFPYAVGLMNHYGIKDGLCEALLIYMQVLTAPLLGAYLYAAHVNDVKGTPDALPESH